MSEITMAEMVRRIEWIERDAVRRVDLDREIDNRKASDIRLEDAVKDMKSDLSAIRESQKWAFRLVASTLLVAAVGFLVSLINVTGAVGT